MNEPKNKPSEFDRKKQPEPRPGREREAAETTRLRDWASKRFDQ